MYARLSKWLEATVEASSKDAVGTAPADEGCHQTLGADSQYGELDYSNWTCRCCEFVQRDNRHDDGSTVWCAPDAHEDVNPAMNLVGRWA